MKSEPKAFASLSSGLLARKGAARPAMRPQGFGAQTGAGLEDLGWNDMGFEAPKAASLPLRDATHDAFGEEITPTPSRNPLAGLTPVQSPVHSQHAEIAERLASSTDEGDEDYDDTAEIFDGEEAVEVPFATAMEVFEPEIEPEPLPVVETVFVPEPMAEAAPVLMAKPAPIAAPAKVYRAPKPRSEAASKTKAAFTLRLDPERHLKLRLACAVGGRSAQQIVTDALDALLADMPELEAMAAKANRKG